MSYDNREKLNIMVNRTREVIESGNLELEISELDFDKEIRYEDNQVQIIYALDFDSADFSTYDIDWDEVDDGVYSSHIEISEAY